MKDVGRISIFNSICIPLRIGMLLLIYFFSSPYWAILTGYLALGFLYQIFYGKMKGNFGGNVYWSRAVHFATFTTATVLLIVESTRDEAFWALAADIIFGYLSFFIYYSYFIKMNKILI